MYLRARWYDPGRGVFAAARWRRDESFAEQPYSHHPSAYALSNPVNWTDPTGKCATWVLGTWNSDPSCQFIGWERVWAGDLEYQDAVPWGGAAIDFTPVVGDVKGLLEVFTGCDLITGENLGHWRWLGLLGVSELRTLRHADEIADVRKYADHASRTIAGARRSPLIELTPSEIARLQQEFREIGGDPRMLRFNKGAQTGFLDSENIIYVRGDVLPLEGVNHPRSRMSSRATLAHELVHARYNGTPLPPGAWNDEFRASYLAARHTPGLSPQERYDLIADAIERAREAGVPIAYNDFIRRVLYGDWERE